MTPTVSFVPQQNVPPGMFYENQILAQRSRGLLQLDTQELHAVVQAGFQNMVSRVQNGKPCGSCGRR